MTLDRITPESLEKISNKELLNLHIRVHQLYSLAVIRNNKDLANELYRTHGYIVSEMSKRKIKHSSPLKIVGVDEHLMI